MNAIKFKHKFIDEENIVIIKHYGNTYLEDLFKSAKALYSDKNYNQGAVGITDFRDSNLKVSKKDIEEYLKLEITEPKAILTRWAVIVSDPESTASGMIYQMLAHKHKVGIFSTWQGAASFLNIKLKESDVELFLKNKR